MRCRLPALAVLCLLIVYAPLAAKAGTAHYRPFVRTEYFACPPTDTVAAADLALEAPTEVAEHRLATCRVRNVAPTAAVLWEVSPADVADLDESGDRLLMVAPPGTYRVTALVVDAVGGKTTARRLRATVVVKGKPPAKPPTAPPPSGSSATKAALAQIAFSVPGGSSHCTATVVAPRLAGGGYHVLTAAHCIPEGSTRGRIRLSTNRVYDCAVRRIDRDADICWLEIPDTGDAVPTARLATAMPSAGAKVWHQGYGEDRPGNREDGEVAPYRNTDGQQGYILNVSSGDSGGGIFLDSTGELLGPVCCTRTKKVKTLMWAGTAIQAARLRPPVE